MEGRRRGVRERTRIDAEGEDKGRARARTKVVMVQELGGRMGNTNYTACRIV